MSVRPRVVFDCNVYFQALISAEGPSAKCLTAASRGEVVLFSSNSTVAEFTGVANRPDLRNKFRITDIKVAHILEAMRLAAKFMEQVEIRYTHPSDPSDSHYVNLALAANAQLIVSRDRDLLRLREPTNPDGMEFLRLDPALEIMQPPDLLRLLAQRQQT